MSLLADDVLDEVYHGKNDLFNRKKEKNDLSLPVSVASVSAKTISAFGARAGLIDLKSASV